MRIRNKIKQVLEKCRWTNSAEYWEKRYESGGDSGVGSYNKLAEFKADIINDFVNEHNIKTVIEWGCGDGNQLKLANYREYIGIDVSQKAVSMCKEIFAKDSAKKFYCSLTDELPVDICSGGGFGTIIRRHISSG